MSQLEMIQQIYSDLETKVLIEKYDILGAKIFKFISYAESEWKS